jgi:hypothetical protein
MRVIDSRGLSAVRNFLLSAQNLPAASSLNLRLSSHSLLPVQFMTVESGSGLQFDLGSSDVVE